MSALRMLALGPDDIRLLHALTVDRNRWRRRFLTAYGIIMLIAAGIIWTPILRWLAN